MHNIEQFIREKHRSVVEIREAGGEVEMHDLVRPALETGRLDSGTKLKFIVLQRGWGRQDGDIEAFTQWWDAGYLTKSGKRQPWALGHKTERSRAAAARRRPFEELALAAIPEACSIEHAKAAFYKAMQDMFVRREVTRPPITHWFGKDIIDADQQ